MVLEGISFTSLILIAHLFTRSSVEAALKYLIFNIISSGFFILGIFFIFYSELLFYNVSDISFTEISNVLYTLKESEFIVIKIAINCVLLSFFFKLGVFPLHTWIPDVYEGTWDLVMFILATAVKVVYFFFFIKLFSYVFFSWFDSYVYVLLFGGIGSIHYGCFGALNQEKVKRMLAYTSIGQMGFAFLGLSSGSVTGFSSSLFHIFSYVLTLSLFFIGYLYITSSMNVELSYISDLTGLSRKYPILSLILTITLLSMAGLPPFIGFFTKYYIFVSLMDKGYYLLTLYSIIISVITSFIYLRLIKLIWFDFLLESGLVQTQGFTEITLLKLDEILLISGISNINKVKLKPILYILTCIFEFLIYLIILAYILYVALFMFIPELYFEFLTKMCISLINPF
jgi:NADH-quinone oxidoreductase subunit N